MALDAGSSLGPYEILAPLGAGGMGEVYRARDPRLGREVAIKVLPASFSADPDRLRRFEQEARAASILNHPNITAVFDIGQHDGAPYVVQELLEGETLRSTLAGGRLAARKALDYSIQITRGLAAAHDKGIVHRDLKPENLFVTRDGRLKILDFGLAKLTQAEEAGSFSTLQTATVGTQPGVVLGTLGYMSPEQVRGKAADTRSDIFSFGAILYEMISGKRAFHGDSAADTMSAILREDPPDLSVTNRDVSPALDRVVRHCLEKSPEQRFHSAHDLAFDLEALSGVSTPSGPAALSAAPPRPRGRRIAVLALAVALLAFAFETGRRIAARPAGSAGTIEYQRLTFRRGNVLYARFAPDHQNVVYSAAWDDRPAEIFVSRIGSPESRPLGLPSASLLAVSSRGELAIALKRANVFGTAGSGTLARVSLGGGAPREILEDVLLADWGPDGDSLAVLREREGKRVLEFPIGKPLYTSAGDVSSLRVAPDGNSIALTENLPTEAQLVLVDLAGKSRTLVSGWIALDTLVWSPSAQELWFDGINAQTGLGVYAVDLAGRLRVLSRASDLEIPHDVASDGTVVLEREIGNSEISFGTEGQPERNLSWLQGSSGVHLSSDGRRLLFIETREAGGDKASVYLRSTDGAPAVRLGDGRALDLSPDEKWVLALVPEGGEARLVRLPTGPGAPDTIAVGDLVVFGAAFLPPDGRRIVLAATEPGHGARGYLLEPGGTPRAFTPEGMGGGGAAISPDGTLVAASGPDGSVRLYPIAGGEAKPVPGLVAGDAIVQWGADGDSLYVTRFGELPLRVFRYRLSTGRKEPWKELAPADRAGFIRFESLAVSRDGRSYAYSAGRVLASDLYVVRGWK